MPRRARPGSLARGRSLHAARRAGRRRRRVAGRRRRRRAAARRRPTRRSSTDNAFVPGPRPVRLRRARCRSRTAAARPRAAGARRSCSASSSWRWRSSAGGSRGPCAATAGCWSRPVDADEFRRRGHELIDWIADHVEGVGEQRVAPDVAARRRARRACRRTRRPRPSRGRRSAATSTTSSCPGIVHWQHPSFFAYFPSNTSYPSILGELLSAGLGVQGMSWVTSPACTELETLMLDWMAELLDLPRPVPLDERRRRRRHPGLGQRGHARRHPVGPLPGDGGRRQPRRRHDPPRRLRHVAGPLEHREGPAHRRHRHRPRCASSPTTAGFAMDPAALAAMIDADVAAGLVPFFVCATRGTTSSLAFDPVVDIAPICREHGVWLHVDAAMSGIAALEPEHRWVNDGLGLADSYCTNAAQVDGRQLRLRPVLDGRPGRPARRPVDPARVPALGGRRVRARRSTTATGRSRSAAASAPSSCG